MFLLQRPLFRPRSGTFLTLSDLAFLPGKIQQNELEDGLHLIVDDTKVSASQVSLLMQEADADGDGEIDAQEFADVIKFQLGLGTANKCTIL